jgi:hypothetical protein
MARGGISPLGTLLPPPSIVNNHCSLVDRSSSALFSTNAQDAEDTASNTDDKSSSSSSSSQQILREQKQRKPPTIITCSSTKELVHAIDAIVTEDHVVAELGSQLREVSNTIHYRASSDSVYVDVKRNFPKAQTKETPAKETKRISSMRLATSGSSGNVDNTSNNNDNDDGAAPIGFDFREIDKFSDWRSAFFQSSSSSSSSNRYDVLVLDVNAIVGNDLEWTCLDLILEFEQMAAMVAAATTTESSDCSYHGIQYVLVKSLGLNSVASQLTNTVPRLDPNTTNHNRLCRIVATVGVHDYRQTIPGVLNLLQQSHLKSKRLRDSEQHDGSSGEEQLSPSSSSSLSLSLSTNFFVLEVGSHFGTSTVLLNDVFDDVMGVDVGSKIIKEAQKKYPHVFFRAGDAWKTAGLLRLQQEYYLEKEESRRNASYEDGSNDTPGAVSEQITSSSSNRKIGFDAVYVDVGGLSGADGLLDTIALVKSIQYALEPQCIVVKSLCLQRLASRFTPYWKWQKKGKRDFN